MSAVNTDSSKHFDTWGITSTDLIKNLRNGKVSAIVNVATANSLILLDDVEFIPGDAYAVTASINCKVIDFNTRWELPGLSYVDYDLAIIQVK